MSMNRSCQIRFVTRRARQPLPLEDLRVHAHDQHFFVVRPIEDPDPAALGQASRRPPEKVVVEVVLRRRLERVDLTALRIDARHHVLDGAVFPCGVHRLEDEEQPPAILRVELFLQLLQPADTPLQPLIGLLPRGNRARIAGIHILQAESATVLHSVGVGQLSSFRDAPPAGLSLLLCLCHAPPAETRCRIRALLDRGPYFDSAGCEAHHEIG